MNKEIKEILEALKPQDEEFTKAGIKEYPLILSVKEQKILLDYITNLQEENKRLKRDIEAMKHNYNLLVRCIENGESITQKFENGLTYQDYKLRNEKAIEYIKDSNILAIYKLDYFIEDLLNILEGEDKDVKDKR